MRYVILKKIDDIWFATRNRYTAKELEIIVDKLYDDVVDFESINDGDCQGLDDGVIIVKDDGRELDKNGVYLDDDLMPETNNSEEEINWTSIFTWIVILLIMCTLFGGGAGAVITFILWLGDKFTHCISGAVKTIISNK